MRKFGYFFAAFLPLIIATAIQFIASFFMEGMAGLFLSFTHRGSFGLDAITDITADNNFMYVLMMIYAIICITVFSLWYYGSCGGNFLPKASGTLSGLQLAGVIAIIPGAQFACGLLTTAIGTLVPAWMEQYEQLIDSTGLDSTVTLPMFCYTVLLAPIGEELIFRGVTLRLARQSLPFWLANLMQAVLFGAFHMNWIQGCYAFALGVLLGFVCEKGGSIYYSILLHILFNFWAMAISPLLGNTENEPLFDIILLLVMVVSLVLGSLLFLFGIKRRRTKASTSSTFEQF